MQFSPNKRRFLVDALGEAKVREMEASDDSKTLDDWLKEAGIDWPIHIKGESEDVGWISAELGLRE